MPYDVKVYLRRIEYMPIVEVTLEGCGHEKIEILLDLATRLVEKADRAGGRFLPTPPSTKALRTRVGFTSIFQRERDLKKFVNSLKSL